MAFTALYAPWPEQARRSWGWGAIGLVIIGYVVSAIPTLVLVTAVALSRVFTSDQSAADFDASQMDAFIAQAASDTLLPALLLQFLAWGGFTLFWVKVFERRSLASIGIERQGWAGRYLLGLPLGVGLVICVGVSVMFLTAFGEHDVVADTGGEGADYANAFTGSALVGYGVLLIAFLFQGGTEEFVFRGWFMSTLVARWGKLPGVITASFIFALFHLHVFVSGLLFGILAVTGIGLTGLVFSLIALWRRSIIEAASAHGAFNAMAVIAPTMAMLSANPDMDFMAAVTEVFTNATGMAGAEAVTVGPETAAQILACGVVSLVLISVLAARGRRMNNAP